MGKPSDSWESESLAILARQDRDRYLVALLSPAHQRADQVALAMFNLELARIADTVREPVLGLIRLQWWREAIQEMMSGAATRAHPVLSALQSMLANRPAIGSLLAGMIDAREADFEPVSANDLGAFRELANRSAGNLLRAIILASVDAPMAPEIDLAVGHVAGAYALIGRLRSASRDAGHARLSLPVQSLAEAGLEPDRFLALMTGTGAPGESEKSKLLAGALIQAAQADLGSALAARWPAASMPAMLTLGLAQIYLRRLRANGFDLLDEKAVSCLPSDVWRLLWWRFHRRLAHPN